MTTENNKNDFISHEGQKRREFTMEFKKHFSIAMEKSN